MGKFQKNNTLTFKGRYDPRGAHTWIQEIEKIFRVMVCVDAQKVLFGSHMLSKEDDTGGRIPIKDWKLLELLLF